MFVKTLVYLKFSVQICNLRKLKKCEFKNEEIFKYLAVISFACVC